MKGAGRKRSDLILCSFTVGALYGSMLSPADWGGKPPDAHEGSYRLELDLSLCAVDG